MIKRLFKLEPILLVLSLAENGSLKDYLETPPRIISIDTKKNILWNPGNLFSRPKQKKK